MARGAVKAPYTASSAKPYANKRNRKSKSAGGAAPAAPKPARAPQATLPEADDAYTYLPSLPKRHRTSAVQNSLTKDEAIASAGPSRKRYQPGEEDDSEEEDMEARIRKLAMQIAEENPGAVESDESDVDSDMAWEEEGSDEERWGDVFRDLEKGKKGKAGKGKAKEVVKKPAKPLTVNLDESDDEKVFGGKSSDVEDDIDSDIDEEEAEGEDDDEGDDGEEDEFKGFGSADEEDEEDLKAFKPSRIAAGSTGAAAEGGAEDEEDEEDEDEDDDEDMLADPDLPSDLSDEDDAELDDLDAFVDQLADQDAKKRKVNFEDEEPAESGKKRRVLPKVSGPAVGDGEQTLRSGAKLDISTLLASHPSLSSARALLPSAARPAADATKSVLKSGVLAAPLPTVVTERLAREAAYEKTKDEGAKWSGVMKRVREAEHLSFPLQNTGGAERGSLKSGGEMLASFKPQNEMESAVQKLLDSANLTEKGMTELEDQQLQGQDLSVEEIAARRAELRRQRELMFRAENRAKRVAKIKSKTFRKLARRRAEKEGLSAEDMERLEPGTMEREREKMELERARERATQRHGAKNKFGREAMEGDFGNQERRQAREEMLDLRERLKRRIAGQGSGESESEDEDEEDDEEGDEEGIKTRAFDQLATLDKKETEEEGSKGLMGMKFMQKARERDAKRAKEAEEEAKRDIMLFGEAGGDEEEEEEAQVLKLGEGRMVFSGPVPTNDSAPAQRAEAPVPSLPSHSNKRSALTQRSPSPEVNPWLTATTSTAGPSRKRNIAGTTAADKAIQSLKKAKRRNTGQDEVAEDERVDIVLHDAPAPAPAPVAKSVTFATPSGDRVVGDLMPSRPAMFKQRDLVAEAFAGDDVVVDFAKEKERQMEMDAPKVTDTSLMGWGSWGGKGLKKRKTPNPRFLLKTAGTEAAARKDFGQSNVIITERSERKAKQFLPKDLPYPYTSVAQYQASLAQPVGAEWNSRTAVQRETMPRVIKKAGAIIEPVRRLF